MTSHPADVTCKSYARNGCRDRPGRHVTLVTIRPISNTLLRTNGRIRTWLTETEQVVRHQRCNLYWHKTDKIIMVLWLIFPKFQIVLTEQANWMTYNFHPHEVSSPKDSQRVQCLPGMKNCSNLLLEMHLPLKILLWKRSIVLCAKVKAANLNRLPWLF